MSEVSTPADERINPRWLLPSVLAILVGANIGMVMAPHWSVAIAVVSAGLLLGAALLAGHRAHELGLKVSRKSVLWAGVIAVTVWLGWFAVAWLVITVGAEETIVKGARDADVPFTGLMWSLTVVIPFGTVLIEELGFRGVLLRELHRLLDGKVSRPLLIAGAITSLLFGLWHIGPALAQASNSSFSPAQTAGLVLITILFTAASGGLFVWLRHHTDSLLVPAVLHGAVNGAGLLVAWTLARGLWT